MAVIAETDTSYLKMTHNTTIPSRRIPRKEINKRDIVSQVAHTQILDMGLAAPLSAISCCQTEREVHFNTPYSQVSVATWLLQNNNPQLVYQVSSEALQIHTR